MSKTINFILSDVNKVLPQSVRDLVTKAVSIFRINTFKLKSFTENRIRHVIPSKKIVMQISIHSIL